MSSSSPQSHRRPLLIPSASFNLRSPSAVRSPDFWISPLDPGPAPRDMSSRTPVPGSPTHTEDAKRAGVPLTPNSKLIPAAVPVTARVRKRDVWDRLLQTDAGRDKIFKLFQYSIKIYLWRHLLHARRAGTKPSAWVPHLKSTASGLSLTRKCLILFAWRSAIPELLDFLTGKEKPPPPSASLSERMRYRLSFLSAVVTVPNAIADDFFCAYRLGLIGKELGERAEWWSNWCWWADTVVQLQKGWLDSRAVQADIARLERRIFHAPSDAAHAELVQHESDLVRLREKLWWVRVSWVKLLCDFVFSSYDVFGWTWRAEGNQAVSGWLAGVISTAKLYDKHVKALAKP